MKGRFLIVLLVLLGMAYNAAGQVTSIVQRFGEDMSRWAASNGTYDISSFDSMEELISTDPSFRIDDKISHALAENYGYRRAKNYEWDVYISCLQQEVDKGLKIKFSNVKYVSPEEVTDPKSGYQLASCKMTMTGPVNYNEDALFYVKNGKIAKISNYEVTVNNKGQRRVRVDWDDLWDDLNVDTEGEGGYGILYNYSKNSPYGLSLMYNIPKWYMMASIDFGFFGHSAPDYTIREINFTDVLNYDIKHGSYDPKFWATITPAYCTKYFSIGWGFGYVYMRGKTINDVQSCTINESGLITSHSYSTETKEEKTKFLMRPTIRGFIPCNENFFIAISISYNWLPQFKDMNELSFGVGIHYLFD